ncbi:aldo/keto reductase [Kineococcus rhizosphaerae]|uniref:Aryl-alcohol dehydrogenase-like predicted oxidoreductase n=1 Tax=Kineococcus rhizosphaerae TaxID=559628 RepID=A0A2T0R321_9ACTN|nr:aldo/keto reductase [Kineococcus rhizosphaerae]PRY14185.1 aryl-alcohol dehydrogenase-like predicted oxidoreductase [Kineococcus rhizosphaerae]
MQTRTLGRTGRAVGVIGMGCWQIGGSWGSVDEDDALATLQAAAEAGVTFFDTADVYGDGRSERLLGRFLPTAGDGTFVATKMGRRADPHVAGAYTLDAFRAWNDRSRENLGVDTLDLVQLHCPPPEVLHTEAVFDALDTLVAEGRTRAYGVSVETVAEGLAAVARPNVASVQIILNPLRLKPVTEFLPAAAEAGVGVVVRVPLASGLLTGKIDENTTFAADDHRNFNRHGESFDVGETFAGVPLDAGVAAARRLAAVAGDAPLAAFTLRWIVEQPGVSVVIPGARSADQARANAAAADLPAPTTAQLDAVEEVYRELVAEHVHARW